MKPVLKAGLVLGILVEVWTYITGLAGWYKDPAMVNMFYVVVLIELGVLIWGLRLTAKAGNSYGQQVGAGTLMSVYGAVIVFIGSYIFTTVAFPNYFEEVRQAGEQMLANSGMQQEQIKARLDAMTPMQTPFMNSLIGAIMTIVTGLIFSLILGAFIKGKKVQTTEAPAS